MLAQVSQRPSGCPIPGNNPGLVGQALSNMMEQKMPLFPPHRRPYPVVSAPGEVGVSCRMQFPQGAEGTQSTTVSGNILPRNILDQQTHAAQFGLFVNGHKCQKRLRTRRPCSVSDSF